VRDGFRFANSDTGCWFSAIARSTRSATIPDLLALLMLYKGHRFFTKDVKLIWPYFKDFCWTNFWALTASIAFVRIDGDIPVARAIFKTIIGNHVFPFMFGGLRLEVGG
jgi:hypothetical protein